MTVLSPPYVVLRPCPRGCGGTLMRDPLDGALRCSLCGREEKA